MTKSNCNRCEEIRNEFEQALDEAYEETYNFIKEEDDKHKTIVSAVKMVPCDLLKMLKENGVIHDFLIKDDSIGVQHTEENNFLFLMLPK